MSDLIYKNTNINAALKSRQRGFLLNPARFASASSLLTGLVSYWSLDEASGSVAADATGANPGTVTGALAVVAGKIGNARSFDATAKYITTGAVGFPTTAITFAFWAKPIAVTSSAIFLASTDDTANRVNLALPWTGPTIYWDFGNLSAGGRVSVAFNSGWYNVMAFWVVDAGSGAMHIYRNGTLLASSAASSSFNPTGKSLLIGKYATGTTYNGVADEIGLWNRVLTSGERATLYNSGAGLAYPFS